MQRGSGSMVLSEDQGLAGTMLNGGHNKVVEHYVPDGMKPA